MKCVPQSRHSGVSREALPFPSQIWAWSKQHRLAWHSPAFLGGCVSPTSSKPRGRGSLGMERAERIHQIFPTSPWCSSFPWHRYSSPALPLHRGRGVLTFGGSILPRGFKRRSILCFREGWKSVSVFLPFSTLLFSLTCRVSECRFENCHQHSAGLRSTHPVPEKSIPCILPRRVERVCNSRHGGCRRTGGDVPSPSILPGSAFKLCPCSQEQDWRRISRRAVWRRTQGRRWISWGRGCGSWSLWGE